MTLRSIVAAIALGLLAAGAGRGAPAGAPNGQGERLANTLAAAGFPLARGFDVQTLANTGFIVGYGPARRSAVWVRYRAEAIAERRYRKRPRFLPDPRVADPVAWHSYVGSGYERGHLAPNYLISNLYGRGAQRASFLMTNIAPQAPRLNQLLWQRLEEIEADAIATRWQAVQVTVGPIYGEADARLRNGPAIPVAFYRLWLDRTAAGALRALALRVPQSVRGDERLDSFLVSVDRIEAETGLDFYPALPASIEEPLEAEPADPAAWGLAALACMPARYAEDWRERDGISLRFERCKPR